MTKTLEKAYERAATLPEDVQDRLGEGLLDRVEEYISAAAFDERMKEPEFVAWMNEQLAEAEADIEAGRFIPIEELTFERIKADIISRR